jgi:hypothetical protein
MDSQTRSLTTLVVANSASAARAQDRNRVLAYLDHFGVLYETIDLRTRPLPGAPGEYPLIVLAHADLDPGGTLLGPAKVARLREALRSGTGLVSFDPVLSGKILTEPASAVAPLAAGTLEIAGADHFITRRRAAGQVIPIHQPMQCQDVPGRPLARAGQRPLVAISESGAGRAVHWSGAGWMDPRVLGPLSGLDDLLWRGLVWAARKPWLMRGLPPLLTMRVDDVAGQGRLWQQTPLYWVEEANRFGLKPWLGLFLYNLDPETVTQLRELIRQGRATAFPHAFGRPPRLSGDQPFIYYEDALELRADSYDEFIYYDHQRERPWSDAEARRGLAAVDRWYAAQAPLPRSPVALAHWYEMGANVCAHLRDRWGAEFTGKLMDADLPLVAGTPWLKSGPFRREEEGDAFPFTPGSTGKRPVYYADFVEFGGARFFNSLTEIRDDAGYEWAPDNEVTATAARAARQVRRAFDSLALASLFTHETDFIYKIRPENWRAVLEAVSRELAGDGPVMVTLDEGMRYLRAVKTARLTSATFDPHRGQVRCVIEGQADMPTSFTLFDRQDGEGTRVEIPAFQGTVETLTRL